MRIAAERLEPIPVYAEMSSVNPVLLFPRAMQSNAEGIAKGFVDSVTLGVGQFCTNPGIVLGMLGDGLERFRRAAAAEISTRLAAAMLSPTIHTAYRRGIQRLESAQDVSTLARVESSECGCLGGPALFAVPASTLLTNPGLADEVFGPSSLLVECETLQEMSCVVECLPGQLTASLFIEGADVEMARTLMAMLERKVGRIVCNGYPTGVEVSYAMVHGGPFPATSDSRVTSVGATAIERFLRPVCYQNVPAALLPDSLQDNNSLNIWRLRDGKLTQS